MFRSVPTLALAALAFAFPLPAAAANPVLEVTTNQGKITVELFPDKAPKTVENFLRYAKEGFYNGTVFHRVIPGFMIQGGGFSDKMEQKPTRPSIPNEAVNGLKNDRGTLAMARRPDPHSATAQFFINHAKNDFLDHTGPQNFGYAVFGRVSQGMDIVDKIARVATGNVAGQQNVPLQPVVIQSVTVISEK